MWVRWIPDFFRFWAGRGWDARIKELAKAGVHSLGLLTNIALDEAGMKAVLQLDVSVRPADFVPSAKLLMSWATFRPMSEMEIKDVAQRAVSQLPPQFSLGDHKMALVVGGHEDAAVEPT